jgi:hypothetical protein
MQRVKRMVATIALAAVACTGLMLSVSTPAQANVHSVASQVSPDGTNWDN